jgi:hypothetical protein
VTPVFGRIALLGYWHHLMAGFTKTNISGVELWNGSPGCQDGHNWILEELTPKVVKFRVPPIASDDHILRGNLAEFVAYRLALGDLESAYHSPTGAKFNFPANGHAPLNTVSKTEIDIVWLFFAKSANDDILILQEVKVTGDPKLTYANELIVDYEKLFGVNPNATLQTRLQGLKSLFEDSLDLPQYARRIQLLAQATPKTSTKVRLVPTLVHEKANADPAMKMMAIRNTIAGQGWVPTSVTAWAIGLSELNDRLVRLAMGKR